MKDKDVSRMEQSMRFQYSWLIQSENGLNLANVLTQLVSEWFYCSKMFKFKVALTDQL